MMEDKLRLYLWWKGKLSERRAEGKGPIALPAGKKDDANGAQGARQGGVNDGISEALKRKDRERQERSMNRQIGRAHV